MIEYKSVKVGKTYKGATTGDLFMVTKIFKGSGIADQQEFVKYVCNGKKYECGLKTFCHCVKEVA